MALEYPEIAARPCRLCERFLFSADGEVVRRPAVGGEPVVRPPGTPTPCAVPYRDHPSCPKIPGGAEAVRESAEELSESNRVALEHYRECRAVASFPDDEIARRHARIIREVEDERDRASAVKVLGMLFKGAK